MQAFSWNEGFKEYYAIKAAPNPYLMKILRQEGFGIDCSSIAEPLGVGGNSSFVTYIFFGKCRSVFQFLLFDDYYTDSMSIFVVLLDSTRFDMK